MPNRVILVHEVVVHFDGRDPQKYDGDKIVELQVVRRRLSVALQGPSVPTPVEPVRQVEITYRAHSDQQNYVTVVAAGEPGSPDAADHIRMGPPRPTGSPRPPVEIPARDIRPGQTFAVVAHSPKAQEDMSKDLEAGWHRSDCTWYYPY